MEDILVRADIPASVIWRASRLSDLRDVNPASFLKPLSETIEKERLMLCKLFKPRKMQ